jgi:hypothetical protein
METILEALLKEIANIKDNGNNTAARLRSVLINMLNFSNDGFEIFSPDVVTTDSQRYHYSFKGTKNQCCNVFLYLHVGPVNEKNPERPNNFSFLITEEEYVILSDFIPDEEDKIRLIYNLPIVMEREMHKYASVSLRKEIDSTNNATLFTVNINTTMEEGDRVITTLPLNYKKLTISDKKKAEELNTRFDMMEKKNS